MRGLELSELVSVAMVLTRLGGLKLRVEGMASPDFAFFSWFSCKTSMVVVLPGLFEEEATSRKKLWRSSL